MIIYISESQVLAYNVPLYFHIKSKHFSVVFAYIDSFFKLLTKLYNKWEF